jgi:hypothetical protein
LTCTITKIGKIVFYSQVCYFFPFSFIYGQDEEEKTLELLKFGMGLHREQFKLTDISNDLSIAPANKLGFTINTTQKFRIEPEIGFMYYNPSLIDQRDLSLGIGSGVNGNVLKVEDQFLLGLKAGECIHGK